MWLNSMLFRYSARSRDPSTKPSRGWLRIGVSNPQFILVATVAARNKVTATPRSYWRGCPGTRRRPAGGWGAWGGSPSKMAFGVCVGLSVVCLSHQTRRKTPQLLSGRIAHEEWKRTRYITIRHPAKGPAPPECALFSVPVGVS